MKPEEWSPSYNRAACSHGVAHDDGSPSAEMHRDRCEERFADDPCANCGAWECADPDRCHGALTGGPDDAVEHGGIVFARTR